MSFNNDDSPTGTTPPDAPVSGNPPAHPPQSPIPLTTDNLNNHQWALSVDHWGDEGMFSGSEDTPAVSRISVAQTFLDTRATTVEFTDDNESNWSMPSSSTTRWPDQLPFHEYQSVVQEFASARIWPGAHEDRITVQRMKGTGANRLTGVSLAGENGEDDQHYILRQTRYGISNPVRHPRPPEVRYDRDAAFCSFLRTHTTLEVEDVVMYDLGYYNDLGDRYIVQKRIPGVDAESVVDDLTHEQRCRVAREIGLIFRERLAVRSTHAGYVELTADPEDLEGKNAPLYSIAPFGWHLRWGNYKPWDDWRQAYWRSVQTDLPEPPPLPPPFIEWPAFDGDGPSTPYSEGQAAQSIEAIMVKLLSDLLEMEETRYPDDPLPDEAIKPCRKLVRIAQQLGSGGLFDDVWNCPATFDGFRVNLDAGPDEPMVTGEVHHTGAFIGPSFAACATPYWLWVEAQDRHFEDDVFAPAHGLVKPRTDQQREVKAIFEEAAGPDYRRFADNVHYETARKLLYFAVYADVYHPWVLEAAEDAIKEWDEMRAEDKFPNLPNRLEELFASDTE